MKCGCTTIIVNVYNVGSDQIIDRQEVISTMSVFIIYPVPRGDDRGNVEVAGQSGARSIRCQQGHQSANDKRKGYTVRWMRGEGQEKLKLACYTTLMGI